MLRCREVIQLVSESLDRQLPLRQRLAVQLHLMMCKLCRGFVRQWEAIHRYLRVHPDDAESALAGPQAGLTEAARARLKEALRRGQW